MGNNGRDLNRRTRRDGSLRWTHGSGGMRTHPSMKPLTPKEISSPARRGFGVADPNSPKHRIYDDPEVEALREKLREHNGIRGLEICEPHETQKIARIFHRDGFAVVKDLLNVEQLARWREGCAEALRDILSITGTREQKIYNRNRTTAPSL